MSTTPHRPTVLITGCTPGGIGHALARHFHTRRSSPPWRVLATARERSKIADLAAMGIETLEVEVTSDASVAALAAEVQERLGEGVGLEMLVNNAGRNYTVPALDVDAGEAMAVLDTNVVGVVRMCAAFGGMVVRARGTVVQIGSVAGTMPYVFGSVYNASKAALHAYSDTLRVELAPFGVRVVTVVTGGVKSNITRVQRRLGEDSIYLPLREEYEVRVVHSQTNAIPAEVYAAQVVRQLLGTRKDTIWAGGKAGILWFLTKFCPRWVLDAVMTNMFNLNKLRQRQPASLKKD